ncbi:hypothetical protein PC39_14302 [Salinisphaera sp. PC39]|uniref:hypothetical protein n=1 Tax=Salinisphaera sp. PC39 TaxID=1304156 RepID=UPI00333EE4C3
MSSPARRLIHLLVVLCLTANGLAWAGHVDLPAPAGGTSTAHAHVDGGDLVDRCDHCCHAGAHLLALAPTIRAEGPAMPAVAGARVAEMPVETLPDPPFIPPIA